MDVENQHEMGKFVSKNRTIMKLPLTLIPLILLVAGMSRPAPLPFPSEFGEGKEELVRMLGYLHEADLSDRAYFSRFLEPSKEDCEAIFESSAAIHFFRWERRIHRRIRPIVTPFSESQTELAIWETHRAELLSYEGQASAFPGGYREIAKYLKPGVQVYRVSFREPGRIFGASYDLFVYVNGRWVLLWEPWRVAMQ